MFKGELTPVLHHGDSGGSFDCDPKRITFPFERLEREQLMPGVTITGMNSKADVEAMLAAIKDVMVVNQAPQLGTIEDKTRWRKPSRSHKMFELIEAIATDGETATLVSASATILRPDRGLVRQHGKETFVLHDLVRVVVNAQQAIGFRNGQSITVGMRHEYGMYVGSTTNRAKGKSTHSVFLSDRDHPNSAAKEAVKAARPPAWVRSASELEEIQWRALKENEGRRERARLARITRDMKLPPNWRKREKAVYARNKYHIDHPAIGGLPSLGKNSK